MKKYILIFSSLLALMVLSCSEGIDPITQVDPGSDASSPVVNITFPVEGSVIQVLEVLATIDVKFEVTDDIELSSVKVDLDGSEIASFNEFTDYRRFLGEFSYDQISNGPHTLSVIATDLEGKSTTSSVNFEKEAPYEPIYEGELLYMPFDGDFIDLVSITRPDVIGNPTFAGESLGGLDAYKGATDSYLSFSTEGLFGSDKLSNELTAVFWMKVNNDPNRAGVLVMGPPDEVNPDAQNNRSSGFRFFREDAGGMQRFKLNVGRGDGDSWFDGGAAADVMPNTGDWVHLAFTISDTKAAVYINGQVAQEGEFTGVDWTGCDVLSIMSGAPRFTGWNHLSDQGILDELRLFNRELSQSEIQDIIFTESGMVGGYQPKYDGEVAYMSFDGDNLEMVSRTPATIVGTPGFAGEGVQGGDSYAGAEDSYLTLPTDGLLNDEFSAVFWLKPNASPDRAGILVIGPPDEANPDAQNNRSSGFRFFREGSPENQIFKLNVGRGDGDSWFDGGADATIEIATTDWVHLAFTISNTESVVYIDGEVAKQGEFTGVDWTGCDILSIMSGAPRFSGWNHNSDQSYMDELRIFSKALSQDEIKTIIEAEK